MTNFIEIETLEGKFTVHIDNILCFVDSSSLNKEYSTTITFKRAILVPPAFERESVVTNKTYDELKSLISSRQGMK